MIWTEEQKTEMQRLRNEGVSNNLIGQIFGVSGDKIRKVLARFMAGKIKADTAIVPNIPAPDSLRRLHDEFDAKVPERASSRPQWAGRPPLRIMPKDFQKERFNREE